MVEESNSANESRQNETRFKSNKDDEGYDDDDDADMNEEEAPTSIKENHIFDTTTTLQQQQNNFNSQQIDILYDYDKDDCDKDNCSINGSLTLEQFVDLICTKQENGLSSEYEEIVEDGMYSGQFSECMKAENTVKNRYFNVKCYDHTRVILNSSDNDEVGSSTTNAKDCSELFDNHDYQNINYQCSKVSKPQDSSDYINANYVDGYRQAKAYISTQGPLLRTTRDFWRMMWQTGSRIIVMLTQATEDGNDKCNIYWPTETESNKTYGNYKIRYKDKSLQKDYVITRLELTNTLLTTSREIWHFQFNSWPDFGVPQSAEALLKFRETIIKKQREVLENCLPYPPIVVHCSAGVGRTGTFITIDICIQRFEATGLIDVCGVVKKLRAQRYMSIQTKDQYFFCHYAILEYAQNCGLLREFAGKLMGKFKIE